LCYGIIAGGLMRSGASMVEQATEQTPLDRAEKSQQAMKDFKKTLLTFSLFILCSILVYQ
jgi:hypothetical protein